MQVSFSPALDSLTGRGGVRSPASQVKTQVPTALSTSCQTSDRDRRGQLHSRSSRLSQSPWQYFILRAKLPSVEKCLLCRTCEEGLGEGSVTSCASVRTGVWIPRSYICKMGGGQRLWLSGYKMGPQDSENPNSVPGILERKEKKRERQRESQSEAAVHICNPNTSVARYEETEKSSRNFLAS